MNAATTNRRFTARRIILPLAALLAAAAVAVGSGASFVSSSVNTASSYTTGTLTQSNSKANTAIFTLGNLKPGDSLSGTVTITNSGSLPASFRLTETGTNGFVNPDNLTLKIAPSTAPTTPIWSGTFGALTAAGPLALAGDWAAGEARTYVFTATLAQSANNTEQGKNASASYQWDAIQTAAVAYNQ
ncbi:camelysin-like metallo-endopeptidase [Rhodoglobus vestalii]|uniref:Camelysin-like metallo-endopeptidase n=1 Tax=Rhodoglobus vestalii TaxID=193384 RepID=A0A8H2KCC6_9MICO|nr:TasA family protein [Rhodoglobus vestalii]TQO20611.1 camelysin-like metallo-endopeptidase [Rhodoglobus vestalii]